MIASDSAVRGDERTIGGSKDSETGYPAHMLRSSCNYEICCSVSNRIYRYTFNRHFN